MSQAVSYKMNLPADVDRWIREEAEKECRSRSGQIIYLLRERMEESAAGEGRQTLAPAATNNTALQGGASITQG